MDNSVTDNGVAALLPRLLFSEVFFGALQDLQPNEQSRVITAIVKYTNSPNHTSLNLEQLKGRPGQKRLWTIHASQELRILLARQGGLTVFVRAGHHDAIYRLARQSAFVVPAPAAGAPGLITTMRELTLDQDTTPTRSALESRLPITVERRSIVEHWTAKELMQVGFTESEVDKLRLATQDTLLDVWPELDNPDKLDLILKCCEGTPETVLQGDLLQDEEAENARFREAIIQRGALAGLSSLLTPEEVERLMSAPPQGWHVSSRQGTGVQGGVSSRDLRERISRSAQARADRCGVRRALRVGDEPALRRHDPRPRWPVHSLQRRAQRRAVRGARLLGRSDCVTWRVTLASGAE